MNKIVSFGILASLLLSVLNALFQASLAVETVGNLYALSGMGMFVFGIWASVLLLKK